MKRTQRIAKRAAAVLLCVVLLSITLIMPQAYAGMPLPSSNPDIEDILSGKNKTPINDPELERALASLTENDWRMVMQHADIMAGIGAAELAIASGQYTGQGLERIISARDSLRLIEGGAGATAVAASPWLLALAQVGGVVAVMTDWTQVLGALGNPDMTEEEHRQWREIHIYEGISNPFYNWSANYSWASWYIVDVLGGYEYENRADKNGIYWELTQEGWGIIADKFRSIFGSKPGAQEIPAVGWTGKIDMMGAEYLGDNGSYHKYRFPLGTSVVGYVGAHNGTGGTVRRMWSMLSESGVEVVLHSDNDEATRIFGYTGMTGGYLELRVYHQKRYLTAWEYDAAFTVSNMGDMIRMPKEWLGIPATPYITMSAGILGTVSIRSSRTPATVSCGRKPNLISGSRRNRRHCKSLKKGLPPSRTVWRSRGTSAGSWNTLKGYFAVSLRIATQSPRGSSRPERRNELHTATERM